MFGNEITLGMADLSLIRYEAITFNGANFAVMDGKRWIGTVRKNNDENSVKLISRGGCVLSEFASLSECVYQIKSKLLPSVRISTTESSN